MDRAPTQTATLLRAALRRAVIAADPAAAEQRRATATVERGVWRHAIGDGLSRLEWIAPSEQIEAAYQWISGLAGRAQSGDRDRDRAARDQHRGEQRTPRPADTHPDHAPPGHDGPDGVVGQVRTLDQCRSDVLGDLAEHALCHHDLPRHHGRAPQIHVVVAAATLLGLDDEPAELTGVGPITAHTARRIAEHGTWRRLLTDPAGRLVEVSTDTYQPTQAIRDHVTTRDPDPPPDRPHWPPGAHRPHGTHGTGGTDSDNGPGAAGTRYGHGDLVWTLPSGQTYRRAPEPVLDHPALDPPGLRHALRQMRTATPRDAADPDPPPRPDEDTPPF